jgi:penicillin G amidase
MTRAWRWVAAAVLVAIGGSAVAGLWLLSSATPATGRHEVEGLTAPVALLRDRWGVPHIFAESDEDASFALGWAHAEDRLWQMEAMRRLGAGRLAEVLGPAALASDRWMRTLGLYRLAERDYAALSGDTRRVFDAYSRGVNAWLASRTGALPPEFLLLWCEPQPWTPADSLVWLKLMALRLSSDRHDELLRARLAGRLTPRQLGELWPDDPPDAPTTLAAAPPGFDSAVSAALAAAPDPPGRPFGASNAWVVAGSRTASGKPILANDPHLGFTLPVPWYLARLVTPRGELVGATSPGFPAVVLGRNARIAWGITSSDIDVEDIFVERVDPADPDRYQTPGGSQPFVARDEVIAVKGAPAERRTVRSTRHGPVISDLPGLAVSAPPSLSAAAGAGQPVVAALAATWLGDDDRTADALIALDRASDWREVLAAAEVSTAPQQNVLYADVDGHIGFVSAGRIPLRPAGGGRMPVPGWTGAADWTGFVPPDGLPEAFDPSSGALVNANNSPVPRDFPWPIRGAWDAGFRAQRIEDLLAAPVPQTVEGTAALQLDSVSLMARRLLPLMLEGLPEPAHHPEVVARLRSWDGTMRRDRPEPLIFAAWLREFVRALAAEALGASFDEFWDYRPRFVESVLTEQTQWCDDIATTTFEDCPSRLDAALDAALATVSRELGGDPATWRWGKMHQARFEHPFWRNVPLIGALAGISVEVDGGEDTINRGASRLADPDHLFAAVHGAGFRGVYDLGDLGNSRFVLSAGQSGNPLSRHYRDMTSLWREGAGIRLNATRDELENEAENSLLLVPAPQQRRP